MGTTRDEAAAEVWYRRAIDADTTVPRGCWAANFALRREAADAYAAAVRALTASTRRSTPGISAFLAAAGRGACACNKCAVGMD